VRAGSGGGAVCSLVSVFIPCRSWRAWMRFGFGLCRSDWESAHTTVVDVMCCFVVFLMLVVAFVTGCGNEACAYIAYKYRQYDISV